MSTTQALLDCTFGWGKSCRLYRDSIEIAGRSYNLDDLTYIQPTYRNMFGIPSARLELCFGLRRLTLRGIPDPDTVRQMVSHLLPYAEHTGPDTLSHRARLRATQARDLARAQARAWERTNKIPALPNVSSPNALSVPEATPSSELPGITSVAQPVSLSRSAHAFDDFLDFSELPTSHIPASDLPVANELDAPAPEHGSEQAATPVQTCSHSLPEQPASPVLSDSPSAPAQPPTPGPADLLPVSEPSDLLRLTDLLPVSEPPAALSLEDGLSAPETPPSLEDPAHLLPGARVRPMHIPRLQPPLRSVQLVNPEEQMLETGSMPVPAIKTSVLPIIHVPVRLQPGECAHYSIGAALCSDRLAGSERAPYPPLDHGLLILTNRRIFYQGKRCQLILAYTHLWYVSLLHNAIALHIEGQFRRIIMEIEHPQEWASRIEQLAFIARRPRPRAERPATPLVLPGIKASPILPSIALKRAALQLPRIEEDPAPEAATKEVDQPIAETNTLEFDPPVNQHITEANTLEFSVQIGPHIADAKTNGFALQGNSPIAEVETSEFDLQTTRQFEDEATRLLTFHEPGEEVTSKLLALSDLAQSELEERETSHLARHDQVSDDETTIPLRRRNIAAITTHPLRPKTGQSAAGRNIKTPRASQSRALSRPRFLKTEHQGC